MPKKRQISNSNEETYSHRYSHYRFEIPVHPNDSPIELEEEIDKLHLD